MLFERQFVEGLVFIHIQTVDPGGFEVFGRQAADSIFHLGPHLLQIIVKGQILANGLTHKIVHT